MRRALAPKTSGNFSPSVGTSSASYSILHCALIARVNTTTFDPLSSLNSSSFHPTVLSTSLGSNRNHGQYALFDPASNASRSTCAANIASPLAPIAPIARHSRASILALAAHRHFSSGTSARSSPALTFLVVATPRPAPRASATIRIDSDTRAAVVASSSRAAASQRRVGVRAQRSSASARPRASAFASLARAPRVARTTHARKSARTRARASRARGIAPRRDGVAVRGRERAASQSWCVSHTDTQPRAYSNPPYSSAREGHRTRTRTIHRDGSRARIGARRARTRARLHTPAPRTSRAHPSTTTDP